jgi:hypothetical protein
LFGGRRRLGNSVGRRIINRPQYRKCEKHEEKKEKENHS